MTKPQQPPSDPASASEEHEARAVLEKVLAQLTGDEEPGTTVSGPGYSAIVCSRRPHKFTAQHEDRKDH